MTIGIRTCGTGQKPIAAERTPRPVPSSAPSSWCAGFMRAGMATPPDRIILIVEGDVAPPATEPVRSGVYSRKSGRGSAAVSRAGDPDGVIRLVTSLQQNGEEERFP